MLKEKIFQMKQITDGVSQQIDLRFLMCGTTYPNRNYSISRPSSTLSCIEFIVSGTGHVQAGDQYFTPTAGDTYFLPQGIDHFYYSDRKEPWEKIWVNLTGEFVTQLSSLYGICGIYHFPKLDTSDLLLKLQYYADRPTTANTPEKCASLVNELFYRMSRSTCATEPQALTPAQKMLAYIEQHQTDVIRLEQLAEVCQKSPSQAERLFRNEVGLPPYRYVLNRKIELACQLLNETGMSVQDIASYLSFDDAFYFSGLFRRKTGYSPTQYRNMMGHAKEKTGEANSPADLIKN